MKITTTFKHLHDAGACIESYRKYAKHIGGITKYGRTTPINILDILNHNGLDDFWWVCENAVADNEIFRLIACDIAESVLPIFEKQCPGDRRPRECIEVARRYAQGNATKEELAAAGDAARDAARAAAWAAARDAAGDAAWAARDAAWAAARDAAWAAAWAARDVARAAAWDAARAAARAAAWDAAWAAARDAQNDMIIEIIKRHLST